MGMRFLLVRLSSMGDVILTTPIIRALHEAYPQAEIHFLTRPAYAPLLSYHPLIHAVHLWSPRLTLPDWRWTGVIDLQKNLRTFRLRWRLRCERFSTFRKENLRKWQSVRTKIPLPVRHIVERYGEALRPWGIEVRELGPLEVYIPPEVEEKVRKELKTNLPEPPWLAVGLGGTYETKRWKLPYFQVLLERLRLPVILLGGKTEMPAAHKLASQLSVPVVVGTGRFSLLETAAAIRVASLLLSHDTGTAHLGAAVQTPTAVLWGNTVPEFGMTPWKVSHINIEARHLACRPCSKLGFAKCPRGHHDCMRALTPDYVEKRLRHFIDMLALA